MIGILENIRTTLKMDRGLSGIIYMVQGFICKYVCIVEGLILKKGVFERSEHREGGLLGKRKEGRGFWAICPFFLLSTGEQRRGKAPAPTPGPAAWGFERGQGAGQKHEGSEGILFPCSPGAGAARRGGTTVASGGGQLWPWWQRWRVEGGG